MRVELAGEVERVAVREVAAVREVHAEHGVARLQQREVDRHVGLRAASAAARWRARRRTAPWRARWPATRRRRRTRSRRSSACPGSPRRTCSCSTEPAASSTARLTKFSDAISSRPVVLAARLVADGAGHVRDRSRRATARIRAARLFCGHGCLHPCMRAWRARYGSRRPGLALRAAAIWSTRRWCRPPSNGVSQPQRRRSRRPASAGDDPAAEREDVRVVVLAATGGPCTRSLHERGADAGHLVGGDLLALPAAADHDAAVGAPAATPRATAPRRSAGSPPTSSLCGAEVVDGVPEPSQQSA